MEKDLHLKFMSDQDAKHEKIVEKLLEHDKELAEIRKEIQATRSEIFESKSDVLSAMDKIVLALKDLQQEKIFSFAAQKRMQDVLDEHGKEIREIKTVLKLV